MMLKVPGLKWLLQRYFRLTRGMTLGVRAMLIDGDQRILLVRHGYAKGWHMPGGGVEAGESLVAALEREVEEEAGARLTARPDLHGIFTNFEAFPRDHVAVFVVRSFERTAPAATLEIREQAFFPRHALPAGTTEGTRRRIAEVFDGSLAAAAW